MKRKQRESKTTANKQKSSKLESKNLEENLQLPKNFNSFRTLIFKGEIEKARELFKLMTEEEKEKFLENAFEYID